MNEVFYNRLKEKYANVIMIEDKAFLCSNGVHHTPVRYDVVSLGEEYERFNDDYFTDGITIISSVANNLKDSVIQLYYKKIKNTHFNIKDLLEEWVDYEVLDVYDYNRILIKLKEFLVRGTICIVDDEFMLKKSRPE